MIQQSEYFERIDLYINSGLSQEELIEFESQMNFDLDLVNEVKLQQEVQYALCEQDVIDLRNNICQIVQNKSDIINSSYNDNLYKFDLAEGSLAGKKLNQIDVDCLLNIENSFPKIHLYQHKVAGKENIHQFYKDQFNSSSTSNYDDEFSPFDEKILADVKAALEENDITELRANLKQVALSQPAHKYSPEEIEDYICNRMEPETKNMFEKELSINSSLAREVLFIKDINMAIAENDIIDLRANLNKIQHSEIQHSVSIEELEKYINNELSFEQLASFEENISSNKKLLKEIELVKDIDKALTESDIMLLRSNLQNIAEQNDAKKQKERIFIGKFNIKHLIPYTSVAVLIIFFWAMSGIFYGHESSSEIYQKFYTKYEMAGTVRSADINENITFALALQKYENKQYEEALKIFSKVVADDPDNMASHFYSGISLQETGRYNKAIHEYETVIVNKDNLFTEQAEWYTGLCLLQTDSNKKAYKQFKKIALSKGFYQQKAEQILKKINYTE